MKKIIILTLVLIVAASSAFAAASLSIDSTFADAGKELRADPATASATTALIGKTSTGVDIGMLVDATNGTGYSIVTQHKSGSKAFGSSYDSTSLFTTVSDGTPGTVVLAVPTAITTADFAAATWKTM